MARINSYGLDANITDNDKLLGSDESGNTKNFSISSLKTFFESNTGVKKHHQNNASATWTITHNLDLADYLPCVNVKLSGGATFNNVQAMGIVTYLTKDSLKIEFLSAKSGYAYLKK